MQNNTLEYENFILFLNINKLKIELKNLNERFFFLKVWAKNVGAHCMQQNMVYSRIGKNA